jgi:hypothetical protein
MRDEEIQHSGEDDLPITTIDIPACPWLFVTKTIRPSISDNLRVLFSAGTSIVVYGQITFSAMLDLFITHPIRFRSAFWWRSPFFA